MHLDQEKLVVIYHKGCYDGFCTAWLVHKVFPFATFIPRHHAEPLDGLAAQLVGKTVLILDFSFPRHVLEEFKTLASSLVVLDHHESAKAELEGLDYCTFDVDKSGGRLTLEYLQKLELLPLDYTSWLVDYTEDRDLWRHKLPYSRPINAALRTHPMAFNDWDFLEGESLNSLGLPGRLITMGTPIVDYQQKLVDSHVRHAKEIVISGHKILAVNCTCADLTSEVARALASDRPFGACWFEIKDNKRVYSIRSLDTGIDVSKVAKVYGGGGQIRAASFTIPVADDSDLFAEATTGGAERQMAVAVDKKNKIIQFDFGKQIRWMSLPKKHALELADKLSWLARKLD